MGIFVGSVSGDAGEEITEELAKDDVLEVPLVLGRTTEGEGLRAGRLSHRGIHFLRAFDGKNLQCSYKGGIRSVQRAADVEIQSLTAPRQPEGGAINGGAL